jgi:hypothetical protein
MDEFAKKVSRAVKEIKKPANMKKFGDEAAEIIRRRTRLGYGAKENAEREKLKPLSDSYKAQRAGKIAFATGPHGVYPYKPEQKPNLHPHTTPTRSNLTNTGQMLDSLGSTKVKEGSVTVDVQGQRKDGLSNKQVAEYVSLQGREFNNLTPKEQRQIEQIIEREIKKIVRLK